MHEQQQFEKQDHEKKVTKKLVAVAVITPSGTFPNDDDYRRSDGAQVVGDILALAAVHLKLTNTSDWVAYANDKQLNLGDTFQQNGLHDIIEIEWHKQEGGGGA